MKRFSFSEKMTLASFLLCLDASAATWISCGCSDSAGNYQRSCYSTTSCGTCCSYSCDDGSCKDLHSDQGITFNRQDHESKTVSMIEPGPR